MKKQTKSNLDDEKFTRQKIVEIVRCLRFHVADKHYEKLEEFPLYLAAAAGVYTAGHMVSNGLTPDKELGRILGDAFTQNMLLITDDLVKSFPKEEEDEHDPTRH